MAAQISRLQLNTLLALFDGPVVYERGCSPNIRTLRTLVSKGLAHRTDHTYRVTAAGHVWWADHERAVHLLSELSKVLVRQEPMSQAKSNAAYQRCMQLLDGVVSLSIGHGAAVSEVSRHAKGEPDTWGAAVAKAGAA